jgi:hypothetical protein
VRQIYHAALAQLLEALRLERRGWGWNSLTRYHFWKVNRTSVPGFVANECVPSGKWCKSTTFRFFATIGV